MNDHSKLTIEELMAQGLTRGDAWLHGLRLIVIFHGTNFPDLEDGIDFSPLTIENEKNEVFILDPYIGSGEVVDNNGKKEFVLEVSFENDIEELKKIFTFSEFDPTFCLESFFKEKDNVDYQLMESEDTNPDAVDLIKHAYFKHNETEINTTCKIWQMEQAD